MRVLGLMSGTSLDGIDAALAELARDGDALVLRPVGHREYPWPAALRRRLLGLLPPAVTTIGEVCELDTEVGRALAHAAATAITDLGAGVAVDLVVSHGQTVFHWVTDGRARGTLQLGQPAWIVEETGLPVISDLRSRDIAAGGHGAPLASTLDALWLAGSGGPRAALNLGGIANITVVGRPGEPVLAFDTGPANCLLDVTAARLSGGARTADLGGRLAAAGTVRPELLARLLDEPYYRLDPPKSTGRELFTAEYVAAALAGLPEISGPDLMATLTELTAVTVADACVRAGVVEVVASGGGVRNPTLLAALRRRLAPAVLVTSDERGLPAQGKEAYLMALLGYLSVHQLAGVVPGATGSATPRVLGCLSPGDRALPFPAPAPPIRRLVLDPAPDNPAPDNPAAHDPVAPDDRTAS